MYPMTGPWRVTEVLDGGSYRLEHCLRKGRFEKKHASMMSPYPLELVPFEPVDGPDNRFGQLHRPISKSPFVDAGIDGFTPIQPFKLPAHLADVPSNGFYWPSLSELNAELGDFPYLPDELDQLLSTSDSVEDTPIMYTGPPPSPPATPSRRIPSLSSLTASILKSNDKLFFISVGTPSSEYREWRLVRVAFQDSISLHPACLQDGKFLVEFFIPHNDDVRYDAINKRYWLQYHTIDDVESPTSSSHTHLLRPSDTSEQYAKRKGLFPFRQWVNLTHESVFVHGPFEFATINGRRSQDRISIDDWTILSQNSSLYSNPPPKLSLPTYTIHINRGIHSIFSSPECSSMLIHSAKQSNGDSLYC
jgi:hypothetical protein